MAVPEHLERMAPADVLSCVEPFTAARPEEVEQLAKVAVRLRKPAGSTLVAEGHVPDGVFVVLRGRVNLVRMGAGGRDLILSTLGPGDVLGESCAFDRSGMSTSAVAATPVELLRIPGEAVAAHVRRDPETMVRVVRLLSDKLRDIENVAMLLDTTNVEERLRRTLVRLCRRHGKSVEGGWLLAPSPGPTELAHMVGSCRAHVSRTLSALIRADLVTDCGHNRRPGGGRLIVADRLMVAHPSTRLPLSERRQPGLHEALADLTRMPPRVACGPLPRWTHEMLMVEMVKQGWTIGPDLIGQLLRSGDVGPYAPRRRNW